MRDPVPCPSGDVWLESRVRQLAAQVDEFLVLIPSVGEFEVTLRIRSHSPFMLPFEAHVSIEKLERRYRAAKEPHEHNGWQMALEYTWNEKQR